MSRHGSWSKYMYRQVERPLLHMGKNFVSWVDDITINSCQSSRSCGHDDGERLDGISDRLQISFKPKRIHGQDTLQLSRSPRSVKKKESTNETSRMKLSSPLRDCVSTEPDSNYYTGGTYEAETKQQQLVFHQPIVAKESFHDDLTGPEKADTGTKLEENENKQQDGSVDDGREEVEAPPIVNLSTTEPANDDGFRQNYDVTPTMSIKTSRREELKQRRRSHRHSSPSRKSKKDTLLMDYYDKEHHSPSRKLHINDPPVAYYYDHDTRLKKSRKDGEHRKYSRKTKKDTAQDHRDDDHPSDTHRTKPVNEASRRNISNQAMIIAVGRLRPPTPPPVPTMIVTRIRSTSSWSSSSVSHYGGSKSGAEPIAAMDSLAVLDDSELDKDMVFAMLTSEDLDDGDEEKKVEDEDMEVTLSKALSPLFLQDNEISYYTSKRRLKPYTHLVNDYSV